MTCRRLFYLLVALASMTSCAAGGTTIDQPDGSGPADVGPDVADVGPDVVADIAADAAHDATDDADDGCGVCCPGERTCIDETGVGVCADDGSGFDRQDCDDDQICDDAACVAAPICEPGDTKCSDAANRLICRPSGTAYRTESCPAQTSCVDGECASGAADGAVCTSSDDCAADKCRCGDDETCEPAPTTSYCTTTCTPGSCPGTEICVDSEVFPAAGYDHCLPACNETCSTDDMACLHVPTRDSGELRFVEACYPDDAVDIGQPCTAETPCSGGTCLEDYFDTGLCTTECSGNCPEQTACVELQAGTYRCTPYCGDGSTSDNDASCPLAPDDPFAADCATKSVFGGGVKQVCVAP